VARCQNFFNFRIAGPANTPCARCAHDLTPFPSPAPRAALPPSPAARQGPLLRPARPHVVARRHALPRHPLARGAVRAPLPARTAIAVNPSAEALATAAKTLTAADWQPSWSSCPPSSASSWRSFPSPASRRSKSPPVARPARDHSHRRLRPLSFPPTLNSVAPPPRAGPRSTPSMSATAFFGLLDSLGLSRLAPRPPAILRNVVQPQPPPPVSANRSAACSGQTLALFSLAAGYRRELQPALRRPPTLRTTSTLLRRHDPPPWPASLAPVHDRGCWPGKRRHASPLGSAASTMRERPPHRRNLPPAPGRRARRRTEALAKWTSPLPFRRSSAPDFFCVPDSRRTHAFPPAMSAAAPLPIDYLEFRHPPSRRRQNLPHRRLRLRSLVDLRPRLRLLC